MDKDAMIAAYERGECSYAGMYDHYVESARMGADTAKKSQRENPPDEKED